MIPKQGWHLKEMKYLLSAVKVQMSTVQLHSPMHGTYTATINYTSEEALSSSFTATLGSNPELMSDAYDNLTAAVEKAYYTIDFTITQVNGEYKLRSGETDIVVNLQSAFIKALSAETTKLGDDEITVVANKYYVVPVGKTMGETQNTTVAGKIYTIKAPDYLPGVFTVNAEGKTVKFSKGNLQYHCKNGAWRFAEHQWDYIGEANSKISADYDGYIDLFGWGMWLSGQTPTNASKSSADYLSSVTSGEFSGASAFGSEWTTLTSDEWMYLFCTRNTTSNVRSAKATVNSVSGVILLPDNWSSETYNLQSTNTASAAFTENTINAETWSTLEAAGAVFLPAAGGRFGASVDFADFAGFYWSSTAYGTSGAYDVYFSSGSLNPGDTRYRDSGFLVRLVRCMN